MPGEGAVGQVALMGKSLRIDRGQVIVQGNELTTLLTYEKSALIVPMVRDDRVVGIFYLGRVKENAFSAADQEALEAFCQLATVVVESARHLQHTIAHGLHDPLTGLHNRFYYLERLADELRRAKRYRLPLTLMLVKVDDFQPFRDAYGNEVADSAIKGVAEIVKSQTRDTDCLARLAEDFFAILLVQSVKSNAILIAERIRLGVEMRAHGRPGQKRTNITVSIGLASYPQDAHNREELMAASENALEEAKSQGGNHTSFP